MRFLIKACLLDPKTSTAAQRAENWRQAGIKNAGHFSKVMEEVCVALVPLASIVAISNALLVSRTCAPQLRQATWLFMHCTLERLIMHMHGSCSYHLLCCVF